MTQIFLIRHGEAEGNLYRRAQGQSDSPLSPAGRAQLPYLTERFRDVPLDEAWSSDLSRAYDTACAAAEGHGLTVHKDPRLREMCFGVWENQAWGNINYENPVLRTAFLTDPAAWSVPGSERFSDFQDRVYAAMCDIASANDGRTVAVASHGLAIRAFLARTRGIPSDRIAEVTLPSNTSVTLLNYENGKFTTVYENDVSHLPEPPYIPFRETLYDKKGVSRDLRYTPFDIGNGKELYLRCYEDAWRQAHGDLRGFNARACWQSAVLRASDSPQSLQSAWLEDTFAGVLALDEYVGRQQGWGWIAFCYIVPELRRQRCGLQLVGTAVTRFRELGRHAIRLTVAPSNPAVEFYKWLKFEQVGSEEGAVEPLMIMEKRI